MKRCPQCRSTYTDDALVFCLQDGVRLTDDSPPLNDQNAPTLTLPSVSSAEELEFYKAWEQLGYNEIFIILIVTRAIKEGTDFRIIRQVLHGMVDDVVAEMQLVSTFKDEEIDESIEPSLFVVFYKDKYCHKGRGKLTMPRNKDNELQPTIVTVCGAEQKVDVMDNKRPRVYSVQPLGLLMCLYCEHNQVGPKFRGK